MWKAGLEDKASGWVGPGPMSPASFQILVPHEALVTSLACHSWFGLAYGLFLSLPDMVCYPQSRLESQNPVEWGPGTQAPAPYLLLSGFSSRP